MDSLLGPSQQDPNGSAAYAEITSTRAIPTKTGEDETVRDAQLDSDRPGSAGTTHSGPLDTEADGDLIQRCGLLSKADSHPVAQQDEIGHEVRLLSRLQSEGSDPALSFTFTKAPQRQLDFSSSRNRAAPPTLILNDAIVVTTEPEELEPLDRADGESALDQADRNPIHQIIPEDRKTDQQFLSGDVEVTGERTMHDTLDPAQGDGRVSTGDAPRGKKKKKRKIRSKSQHYARPPEVFHDSGHSAPLVSAGGEDQQNPIAYDCQVYQVENLTLGERLQNDEPPGPTRSTLAREEMLPTVPMLAGGEAAIGLTNIVAQRRTPTPSDQLQQDTASHPVREPSSSGNTPRSHPSNHSVGGVDAGQNDNSGVLHHVSDRPSSSRVSKRKTKKTSKSLATQFAEADATDLQAEGINDYYMILLYKYQEREKQSAARALAVQREYQAKLDEAEKHAETQLAAALSKNDQLSKEVQNQTSRMDGYQQHLAKLHKFANGIGSDLKTYKNDARDQRHRFEEVLQDIDKAQAEREASLTQLSECIGENSRLKDKIQQLVKEAQATAANAALSIKHLEQQLLEKSGSVKEERDRRNQLENLMKTPVTLSQATMSSIESHNEAVLDRLKEFQSAVQDKQSQTKMSDLLNTTHAAVIALKAQEATNADNLAGLKVVLNELGRRFGEGVIQSGSRTEEQVTAGIRRYVDEASRTMQEALNQNRTQIDEATANLTSVTALQEKLAASFARIADADAKVLDAQKTIDLLQGDNLSLQSRLTDLQGEVSPNTNVQVELTEIRSQLSETLLRLESARGDSSRKTDGLDDLKAANANLREQIQALTTELGAAQSNTADFEREKERVEADFQDRLRQSRNEMNTHVNNFEIELRAQSANELRRLSSEKNRLEKQSHSLGKELSACKIRIEELRSQTSTDSSKDQELSRLQEISKKQERDAEALRVSVSELQKSLKGTESLKEKYSTISKQLESEKNRVSALNQEKSTTATQLESLQRAMDESTRANAQEKSELCEHLSKKDRTIDDMKLKLNDANEAAKRAAAGLDHYKKSSQEAIDKVKKEGQERIDALQKNLSDVEAKYQMSRDNAETFRVQVEQIWSAEQAGFEERNTKLTKDLADAKGKHKACLEQLEQLKQRAETVEEKLRSRIRASAVDYGAQSAASQQEPANVGKTLANTMKATTELGSVAGSNESGLELPVSVTQASKLTSRGPVVEDSQAVQDLASGTRPNLPLRSETSSLSSEPEDLLSLMDESQTLPRTETETETQTQTQDDLPSFAAFNRDLGQSSQASSIDVPFVGGSQNNHQTGAFSRAPGDGTASVETDVGGKSHDNDVLDDFAVFEDLNDDNGLSRAREPSADESRQNGLRWSQAEMDTYTFQKSYPLPNSASKVVRRHTKDSGRSSQRLDTQESGTSKQGELEASRFGNGTPGGSQKRPQSGKLSHSSSPGFVHQNFGRALNTYQTPAKANHRRRSSGQSSMLTIDPRLLSRQTPGASKRKAGLDSQIQETQEYECDKRQRTGTATKSGGVASSRTNSRSQPQPSKNMIPSSSGKNAATISSHKDTAGSQQSSRKGNLRGSSTRPTRRTRQSTQSNIEKSARFDQVLRGR